MAESREHTLNEFLEFVAHQCDVETALHFLRENNFNVEQAVGAWYDNPDPSRYSTSQVRWDESQWTEDRSGGHSQASDVFSFQIDSGDDLSSLRPLGAPSRPPSRTGPHNSSQEQPRATPSSNQFGSEKVASGGNTTEVSLSVPESQELSFTDDQHSSIADPEPAERAGKKGEPAFLKPLEAADHLSCVISILHSIPLCREMFLARNHVLHEYPYESLWWKGQVTPTTPTTQVPITVSAMHEKELVREMQLLMSFLDGTKRSYGSAGCLSALPIVSRKSKDTNYSYVGVLKAWDFVMKNLGDDHQMSLFTTLECFPTESSWKTIKSYSMNLDLSDIIGVEKLSLYDALDEYFWRESGNGAVAKDNWIQCPAPILIIRLAERHHTSNHLNIEIPAVWFIDRYLSSHREEIRNMKEKKRKCDKIVQGIDTNVEKLNGFQEYSTEQKLNSSEAIKTVIDYIKEQVQVECGAKGAKMESTVTQLQKSLQVLEAQIQRLLQEKKRVQDASKSYSEIFTRSCEAQEWNPSNDYHLRGLAKITSNGYSATYLTAPQETHSEDNIKNNSSESLQWWCLTYDTSAGSVLISKEKISSEEVLKVAGELDCSTLLVYASKDVLNCSERLDVPESLQAFVEEDNQAFRVELLSEERKQVIKEYELGPDTLPIDLSTIAGGLSEAPEMDSVNTDEGFSSIEPSGQKTDASESFKSTVHGIQKAEEIGEVLEPARSSKHALHSPIKRDFDTAMNTLRYN